MAWHAHSDTNLSAYRSCGSHEDTNLPDIWLGPLRGYAGFGHLQDQSVSAFSTGVRPSIVHTSPRYLICTNERKKRCTLTLLDGVTHGPLKDVVTGDSYRTPLLR